MAEKFEWLKVPVLAHGAGYFRLRLAKNLALEPSQGTRLVHEEPVNTGIDIVPRSQT